MKPYGAWVVITPVQFSVRARGRPGRRRARHRQHGRAERRDATRPGRAACSPTACATPACRTASSITLTAAATASARRWSNIRLPPASRSRARTRWACGSTRTHAAPVRWPRPCIAEMGGKNPCIVSARADLERAAAGIVRSAFGMGGQKCSALSRMYVARNSCRCADRAAGCSRRARCASAIRRAARTGWARSSTARTATNYARYCAELCARGGAQHPERWQAAERGRSRRWLLRARHPRRGASRSIRCGRGDVPADRDAHACATSTRRPCSLRTARRSDSPPGFYGAPEEVPWFFEHIQAGRRLRQPSAGRDHRRVARATSPSAAGKGRAAPARDWFILLSALYHARAVADARRMSTETPAMNRHASLISTPSAGPQSARADRARSRSRLIAVLCARLSRSSWPWPRRRSVGCRWQPLRRLRRRHRRVLDRALPSRGRACDPGGGRRAFCTSRRTTGTSA